MKRIWPVLVALSILGVGLLLTGVMENNGTSIVDVTDPVVRDPVKRARRRIRKEK